MSSSTSNRRRWSDLPIGLAMLAPSLVILSVFVLFPLGKAVIMGTKRCNAQVTKCIDNGWDQYLDAARSNEFRHALAVSLKLAAISVPLGLVLGVGLAVLADKYLRGIGFFRTVFSSTVATSVAVASLMWFFLLQPNMGVLPEIGWLRSLFPVIKNPGLLRDEGTAIWAVALSSVWAGLGFTFIVVTAGLQGVPRDLHEAATLDGAGGVRRFWSVTLPMLGPTLLFVVIVLVTRAFQAYGEIDLLTDGGPSGATTNVPYLIFGGTSIIKGNYGLQSAVSVLLFLVLLVLSAIQLRGIGRRVHYG